MSNLALALTIASVVVAFFSLLLVGLSRHKKSSSRKVNVMGAIGVVEIDFDPEGAVIVDGELWRARMQHGSTIWSNRKVRVVGVEGHLLLVKPESDVDSARY
jgi:membrane-bound ClpP family serine protease